MIHPFDELAPEYTTLLSRMKLTRSQEVHDTAVRLLRYVDAGHYNDACAATGVPIIVAAASFEREASSNFLLSPAQGDPWSRPSVHVPAHRGPFPSWTAAAEDAYRIDGLDKVGAASWSWERACYEEELFNGFGYRARGIHSPYLWAGSNDYVSGKYVADGEFDSRAVDTQLGVIPMMLEMVSMRSSLALPVPFPGPVAADSPTPAPAPVPEGHDQAEKVQLALNILGANPQLVIDDNFGRMTKAAVIAFQKLWGLEPDGLVGPLTIGSLKAHLQAVGHDWETL